MEVILQQDVDELGMEGDIVNVARGYARNYLIPRGFALEATSRNIKALESKRKKIELKRLKAKEDAEKLKERVDGISVVFYKKSREEGKLYGSVTTSDIGTALEEQGVTVDRRKIVLDKPIKEVGEWQVPIKIFPEVTAYINVVVNKAEE